MAVLLNTVVQHLYFSSDEQHHANRTKFRPKFIRHYYSLIRAKFKKKKNQEWELQETVPAEIPSTSKLQHTNFDEILELDDDHPSHNKIEKITYGYLRSHLRPISSTSSHLAVVLSKSSEKGKRLSKTETVPPILSEINTEIGVEKLYEEIEALQETEVEDHPDPEVYNNPSAASASQQYPTPRLRLPDARNNLQKILQSFKDKANVLYIIQLPSSAEAKTESVETHVSSQVQETKTESIETHVSSQVQETKTESFETHVSSQVQETNSEEKPLEVDQNIQVPEMVDKMMQATPEEKVIQVIKPPPLRENKYTSTESNQDKEIKQLYFRNFRKKRRNKVTQANESAQPFPCCSKSTMTEDKADICKFLKSFRLIRCYPRPGLKFESRCMKKHSKGGGKYNSLYGKPLCDTKCDDCTCEAKLQDCASESQCNISVKEENDGVEEREKGGYDVDVLFQAHKFKFSK